MINAKALIIVLIALIFGHEVCKADSWTGPDKRGHAIVGAAVGAVTTLATDSPWAGCAAAAAVGAAKEIYDMQHRATHDPSVKDFIVTAAAGCLSAELAGFVVTPRGFIYTLRF